ncbi:MAG: hypothetical protein ACKVU1_13575 [bacterium]
MRRTDSRSRGALLGLAAIALAAVLAAPGSLRAGAGDNLLTNPGFEIVGPQGASTTFTGYGGGGWSSAQDWWVFNNSPGTTSTELLPSTCPGGGQYMLHVTTDGGSNGVGQIFLPFDTGPDQATAMARIFVISGTVVIGTGNGGNTGADAHTRYTGHWEFLRAGNGVSPANEFIVYAWGGPAEFYVDKCRVAELP